MRTQAHSVFGARTRSRNSPYLVPVLYCLWSNRCLIWNRCTPVWLLLIGLIEVQTQDMLLISSWTYITSIQTQTASNRAAL